MGSPVFENPQGTDMPGKPAKLVEMVYTSLRYMEIGSSLFSPNRKAGVGEVGVRIASTSSKALSKKKKMVTLLSRRLLEFSKPRPAPKNFLLMNP